MTTHRENLLLAHALVQQFLDELDTTGHKCDSCGLEVRHNWPEYRIAKELDNIPQRLRRAAENPTLNHVLDLPAKGPKP